MSLIFTFDEQPIDDAAPGAADGAATATAAPFRLRIWLSQMSGRRVFTVGYLGSVRMDPEPDSEGIARTLKRLECCAVGRDVERLKHKLVKQLSRYA